VLESDSYLPVNSVGKQGEHKKYKAGASSVEIQFVRSLIIAKSKRKEER